MSSLITEVAPAKINLYLHVGGVRDDGLHALASLFVFTDTGDVITAHASEGISLEVEGRFAAALAPFPVEDNLVLKAARVLQRHAGMTTGAALCLTKNLPVAAGIGGGSADAAAALRALVRLWEVEISPDALTAIAFDLGADVPACLSRAPVFVSGAGEIIEPGPELPPLWVCLVNPGVSTPTGPVFKAFDAQNPRPPVPVQMPPGEGGDLAGGAPGFCARLARTRNDLEACAIELAPVIADVVSFLDTQPECLLARMSGSGATCFGLFPNRHSAAEAARNATAKGWWAIAAKIHSL